ncbi:MAG: chromate transporter [Hyphomicrobiales bacterium]|nr:chromate transporter [Hyphomicrobiales bacterium]
MNPGEARAAAERGAPTVLDLYLGWGKVGLMGFGGVTPWARRMVVEERKWLDDSEYAGLLGIAQVLPGPNTPNVCIIIGQRFAGAAGAIASVVGLMTVPLLALVALALAYDALAAHHWFLAGVGGAAAAAAGLVLGTAFKMERGAKLDLAGTAVCAAVFAAVGIFKVPLIWAVVVIGPISVALVHFRRAP